MMTKYYFMFGMLITVLLLMPDPSYSYTGCNIETTDYNWDDTNVDFTDVCSQYNLEDPDDLDNNTVSCYHVDLPSGCVALVCCGALDGKVFCRNEKLVCTNDNPPQVNHLATVTLTKMCYMVYGDAIVDICAIVCPEGVTSNLFEYLALKKSAREKWEDTNPSNTWDEDRQEQCNCP